jgi:hypothetical protein
MNRASRLRIHFKSAHPSFHLAPSVVTKTVVQFFLPHYLYMPTHRPRCRTITTWTLTRTRYSAQL